VEGDGVAVLAAEERIDGIALEVGPGKVAFDPEYPVRRKLIIATDLSAAEEPSGGVDPNHSSGRAEIVFRVRLGKVLAAPSGAGVAAEVAAGPAQRDQRRGLEGRFDRHVGGKSREDEPDPQ